jgi:hypothetical protein
MNIEITHSNIQVTWKHYVYDLPNFDSTETVQINDSYIEGIFSYEYDSQIHKIAFHVTKEKLNLYFNESNLIIRWKEFFLNNVMYDKLNNAIQLNDNSSSIKSIFDKLIHMI